MKLIEETVSTGDGLRLYARRTAGAGERGQVVIVHGFGEHCGRYDALIEHLAARGFGATAYDQRGHGLSDGQPGDVARFADYEDDLNVVLRAARRRDETLPCFVIGQSMGALVALRYLANRQPDLAGAVLASPLLAVAIKVPAHKVLIGRVGAKLMPALRLHNEIDPAALSRDPEVARAYKDDSRVTRMVSARWYAEATRAMAEAPDLAAQVRCPLLVLHGDADRIAGVAATRQVFERFGSADKELAIYPGYYHELFNEPEKEQVYGRVTDWLAGRATGR